MKSIAKILSKEFSKIFQGTLVLVLEVCLSTSLVASRSNVSNSIKFTYHSIEFMFMKVSNQSSGSEFQDTSSYRKKSAGDKNTFVTLLNLKPISD
jgi:hypothetical protein